MPPRIVRIVSRSWTRNAFIAMAFLSLAQPLLTPIMPDLAGWSPNHGHVYANGQVIPHTHPWDREVSEPVTSDNVPAGFIFHLCEIHPDGLVPIDGTAATGASAPSDASHDESAPDSSEDEDIAFLFDLNLTGSIMPAPEAPILGCHGMSFATRVVAPLAPSAVFASPTVPPPQA